MDFDIIQLIAGQDTPSVRLKFYEYLFSVEEKCRNEID